MIKNPSEGENMYESREGKRYSRRKIDALFSSLLTVKLFVLRDNRLCNCQDVTDERKRSKEVVVMKSPGGLFLSCSCVNGFEIVEPVTTSNQKGQKS